MNRPHVTTWTPEPHGEFLFSPSYTPQLADTLDDILSFDSPPVRVNSDGTLTEVRDVYSPESFAADGADDETDILTPARLAGWEVLTGYSGQHGYNGPVMHPSEFIGEGLARAILSTPGVYAVASVDDVEDDGYPIGWVVLRKVES